METREIISEIMTQLGPLVDRLHEVSSPDAGRWVLQFDEDAILCQLSADADRLFLTMQIGPLPEARREDVMMALLTFNSLWAETGGVRMSVDQPSRQVMQICDLLTGGIDVAKLAQVVEALLRKADSWKALLAGAKTTVPALEESPGAGAIRV